MPTLPPPFVAAICNTGVLLHSRDNDKRKSECVCVALLLVGKFIKLLKYLHDKGNNGNNNASR